MCCWKEVLFKVANGWPYNKTSIFKIPTKRIKAQKELWVCHEMIVSKRQPNVKHQQICENEIRMSAKRGNNNKWMKMKMKKKKTEWSKAKYAVAIPVSERIYSATCEQESFSKCLGPIVERRQQIFSRQWINESHTRMKIMKIMINLFIHRVSAYVINSLRWIMTDHQLNYSRNIIETIEWTLKKKKKKRTNKQTIEFPINKHIDIGFVSFRLKLFRCEIQTASNWHESVFVLLKYESSLKTNEKQKSKYLGYWPLTRAHTPNIYVYEMERMNALRN